jgi:hypothetical protein
LNRGKDRRAVYVEPLRFEQKITKETKIRRLPSICFAHAPNVGEPNSTEISSLSSRPSVKWLEEAGIGIEITHGESRDASPHPHSVFQRLLGGLLSDSSVADVLHFHCARTFSLQGLRYETAVTHRGIALETDEAEVSLGSEFQEIG